ncbi:hypothetical protein Bbelb_327820 [Branchiostoma belcheri]|nr:hypothetical protein Bbelb_327820 [Branchiostoma belcheri]
MSRTSRRVKAAFLLRIRGLKALLLRNKGLKTALLLRSRSLKTVFLLLVFLGGTLLYLRRTSDGTGQSAELGAGEAGGLSDRTPRTLQDPLKKNPALHNPLQQNPALHNPLQQNPALHNPLQQNPALHNPLQKNPALHNPLQLRKIPALQSLQQEGREQALQDPLQQNSIPAGFQLYVYDLPAEFNRNIVSCVEQATGGCFRLGSSGMGPEFARHGNTSFRRTHMFALEVILHHKARHSRHRTLDPRAADAFYIPYYSGLACLCPHLQAGALNRRLVSHLTARYPYLSRGKPHLMALGKIEREQWSADCGFLALPEAGSIVFAGIEEEFSPALRAHFGRKGRPLIVAPYPAFGHLISSSHQDEASHIAGEPGSRDVFVFLAASSRNAHRIRTALRPQFLATDRRYSREEARRRDDRPVWLLTPEVDAPFRLLRTTPGDSPTRKSFYDAVACGCVPVTFTLDHPVRYPFDKVLNYSDFTVTIDGADVTERNSSILDILRNIPPERIKLLQDNLRKVAPLLQYSYPPSVPSHDAFYMVMAEMAPLQYSYPPSVPSHDAFYMVMGEMALPLQYSYPPSVPSHDAFYMVMGEMALPLQYSYPPSVPSHDAFYMVMAEMARRAPPAVLIPPHSPPAVLLPPSVPSHDAFYMLMAEMALPSHDAFSMLMAEMARRAPLQYSYPPTVPLQYSYPPQSRVMTRSTCPPAVLLPPSVPSHDAFYMLMAEMARRAPPAVLLPPHSPPAVLLPPSVPSHDAFSMVMAEMARHFQEPRNQ